MASIGRNVRIDTRWATANAAEIRTRDGIVRARAGRHPGQGASTVGALLQATRTVPVVFANLSDSGRRRLRRQPGAAGRQCHRFKWLELLKQLAPNVTRVAVLRDPASPSGIGQFGVIQAAAPSLRVEVNPVNVRDPGEIGRALAAFARAPNGGLIATSVAGAALHRDLIIALAAHHKLPAVTLNAPSWPLAD